MDQRAVIDGGDKGIADVFNILVGDYGVAEAAINKARAAQGDGVHVIHFDRAAEQDRHFLSEDIQHVIDGAADVTHLCGDSRAHCRGVGRNCGIDKALCRDDRRMQVADCGLNNCCHFIIFIIGEVNAAGGGGL